MKVLLCEDVEKLGWYGDIVETADGYARNYLLPQRLAVIPSEERMAAMAEEKARRANERKLARQRLEKLAQAVSGAVVSIVAKANEQGHLFGSITESDIAQNLREQGFEVADGMVKLPHHIKELGESQVELKFASDLRETIRVIVTGEDGMTAVQQQPQSQEGANNGDGTAQTEVGEQ